MYKRQRLLIAGPPDERYPEAARRARELGIADRLDGFARTAFSDDDKAFIQNAVYFFLATADAKGRPDCSFKGGLPGFVKVTGPNEVDFADYDGNGMYLSTGNTLENPAVGLLFIDFENRKRFRLNGTASIVPAGSIEPAYLEAQFVVKVHVTQVFPNCPRYIHKMQMVERSSFAPRVGVTTPVPAWKRMEWSCDVLPEGDPARLPDDPGGRAGA